MFLRNCLTSLALILAMAAVPTVAVAPIPMSRACPGHWCRLIKIEITPTGTVV